MEIPTIKIIFGVIAIILGFVGFIPYIYDIHRKNIRPHILSWTGWGLITAIAAIAMLSDGFTWGVVVVFANTFACFTAAIYSIIKKVGVWKTSVYDLLLFGLGIVGVVLWQVFQNPDYAVTFAILADLSFGIPTIIKIHKDPQSETVFPWFFTALAGLTSLLAISYISYTEVAYPIFLAIYDSVTFGLLFLKRRSVSSTSLKLLSLNIEQNKHYDHWIPFAVQNEFDVICLQEVCESDVEFLSEKLGVPLIFTPMCSVYRDNDKQRDVCGVAIGTQLSIIKNDTHYYFGQYQEGQEPELSRGFKMAPRVVMSVLCEKNDEHFNIHTTHFSWTSDSEISEQQRIDAHNLIKYLEGKDDAVLCGDMNAPRGKECFAIFAEKFTDHIPQYYKQSLDMEMRSNSFVGDPDLMVDALFSTDHYRTENVELVSGLSDHMGIVAEIYKKEE